jgi:transcriptional regulatory protein LevR
VIEIKKAYNNFFRAKGGEHLISIITEIVSSNHLKAEQSPELARDYVQRAKGAREVLDHIQSVLGTKEK